MRSGSTNPVTCSCFGSIERHAVDRLTLARNVLLTLVAVAASWFALDGGSGPAAIADLDSQRSSVLVAAAAAVVAVLVAGVRTSSAGAGDGEPLDYERQVIPYGVVSFVDRSIATLPELARTQARLILIFNPSCGPCIRLGVQLDEWSPDWHPPSGSLLSTRTRSPRVASRTTPPSSRHGSRTTTSGGCSTAAPPTAVLLGADGLMAGGPVTGEDEVEALVADVLAELVSAEVE